MHQLAANTLSALTALVLMWAAIAWGQATESEPPRAVRVDYFCAFANGNAGRNFLDSLAVNQQIGIANPAFINQARVGNQ